MRIAMQSTGVIARPKGPVSGTEAELVTTAGALQNQELMTQGKDFNLQSCPSSEAGLARRKAKRRKG
jgi:hypothetical protein